MVDRANDRAVSDEFFLSIDRVNDRLLLGDDELDHFPFGGEDAELSAVSIDRNQQDGEPTKQQTEQNTPTEYSADDKFHFALTVSKRILP